MRQPKPEYALTLTERQEVRGALDNGVLLGALRKIASEESEYWGTQLKNQALLQEPNASLMVQFAGRQAEAEGFENMIRKAIA